MIREHYLQDVVLQLGKYKELAERAVAQVSDEQLFAVLGEESNSIAVVMKHWAGAEWRSLSIPKGRSADYEVAKEGSALRGAGTWAERLFADELDVPIGEDHPGCITAAGYPVPSLGSCAAPARALLQGLSASQGGEREPAKPGGGLSGRRPRSCGRVLWIPDDPFQGGITMRRISYNKAITLTLVSLVLAVASPGLSGADEAESGVAAEIKALINEGNEFTAKNLEDQPGGVSKDGAVEFWSSGGLMQWAAPEATSSKYEQFSITAKHIKVIELPGGEAAVAMYYSEGSMHGVGRAPVTNYRTRVTQVYVKEDGKWVVRAAHWSPIAGGSGTNQVSVD